MVLHSRWNVKGQLNNCRNYVFLHRWPEALEYQYMNWIRRTQILSGFTCVKESWPLCLLKRIGKQPDHGRTKTAGSPVYQDGKQNEWVYHHQASGVIPSPNKTRKKKERKQYSIVRVTSALEGKKRKVGNIIQVNKSFKPHFYCFWVFFFPFSNSFLKFFMPHVKDGYRNNSVASE